MNADKCQPPELFDLRGAILIGPLVQTPSATICVPHAVGLIVFGEDVSCRFGGMCVVLWVSPKRSPQIEKAFRNYWKHASPVPVSWYGRCLVTMGLSSCGARHVLPLT